MEEGGKGSYVCLGALVVAKIGVTVPKYEHPCLPVSPEVALYQREAERKKTQKERETHTQIQRPNPTGWILN